MFRPTSTTSDNTIATDDVPDLHHFAVLATDSAGDTYLSNIQTADYSVPRYPADLAAAALADGNIGVTWSNSAFNESGGILKRSSDGGTTWTSIASLSTDQTAFLDTTAPAGVDVLYEVEYTRTNDSGLAESGYDVMTTPVVAVGSAHAHWLGLAAGAKQPAAINKPATGDTQDVTVKLLDMVQVSGKLVDAAGVTIKLYAPAGLPGWIAADDPITTGADGTATFTIQVNDKIPAGTTQQVWVYDEDPATGQALGGKFLIKIKVN